MRLKFWELAIALLGSLSLVCVGCAFAGDMLIGLSDLVMGSLVATGLISLVIATLIGVWITILSESDTVVVSKPQAFISQSSHSPKFGRFQVGLASFSGLILTLMIVPILVVLISSWIDRRIQRLEQQSQPPHGQSQTSNRHQGDPMKP